MTPLTFQKARAAYFLDCIQNGRPIEPADGKWNLHEMHTLAGVLRFACLSHGPTGCDIAELSLEHQEAVADSHHGDTDATIDFCTTLSQLVMDDEFDEDFEPTVTALVSRTDDGKADDPPPVDGAVVECERLGGCSAATIARRKPRIHRHNPRFRASHGPPVRSQCSDVGASAEA